jgi:D-galacturonate reductase
MNTQVVVIGGGMIAHDQILPSLYQLRRNGLVSDIAICGQRSSTLRSLVDSSVLKRAFPDQSFTPFPPFEDTSPDPRPKLYEQVVSSLPEQSVVIVALPDHLHKEAILYALKRNQHVIAVKPLVLNCADSDEIEREARTRGLFVGVEYHKRFDDRSLMARDKYRQGRFGEFRLGTAALFEKWYYRHSNFQNWCTTENSDAFTYIGCHYVDLVHFITGLIPVSVSVCGIVDKYPNGNEGYLWTDARVRWNNGAILNVQNGLSFPDDGPGTNKQGITMYCAGADKGALLSHDDQYRGMQYCYISNAGSPGSTVYTEPSPDYFQYVDLGGPGLRPVGYGYRSIEFLLQQCLAVKALPDLASRQKFLQQVDHAGIVATPANSRYNEAVIEAARYSITHNGQEIEVGATSGTRTVQ